MTLPQLRPIRTPPPRPPERACSRPGCGGWTLAVPRVGWRRDRCASHAEPLASAPPVPTIRRIPSASDGERWTAGSGPVVVAGNRCEGRGATWREALAVWRVVEARVRE